MKYVKISTLHIQNKQHDECMCGARGLQRRKSQHTDGTYGDQHVKEVAYSQQGNVLKCVEICGNVLKCVEMCGNVLKCVEMC